MRCRPSSQDHPTGSVLAASVAALALLGAGWSIPPKLCAGRHTLTPAATSLGPRRSKQLSSSWRRFTALPKLYSVATRGVPKGRPQPRREQFVVPKDMYADLKPDPPDR